MLTPVDVQNKIFKGGIGYDKRDVESFIKEVASDYETLYRSNVELKDKISTLNESLQHYKSIEDSMQKALAISEKTAEETINAANDKVRQMGIEAEKRAESILEDAKEELTKTKQEIYDLQQLYTKFKDQFTNFLNAQLKIINKENIDMDIDLGEDFKPDAAFNNSGFVYNQDSAGGLGGLGGAGGYVGENSYDDRFERTNQEPAINRTSLNMDPFADAMNGGGRFSKQTGKGFTGNSNKKKTSQSGETAKTSINIKDKKAGSAKAYSGSNTKAKNTAPKENTAAVHKPSMEAKQNISTDNTVSAVDAVSVNSSASADRTSAVNRTASASDTVSVNSSASADRTASASDTVSVSSSASADNAASVNSSFPVNDTASINNAFSTDDTVSVNDTIVINNTPFTAGNTAVSEGSAAHNTGTVPDFERTEVQKPSPIQSAPEKAVSGEVEYKLDESVMLESEDDSDEGLNFISGNEDTDTPSVTIFVESETTTTYSGEVEDKINESTMLGSDDNLNEGFNFLVGNEDEEDDIPIIFTSDTASPSTSSDELAASKKSEDVLEGAVEEKYNKSNLIGNTDDTENGFHYL